MFIVLYSFQWSKDFIYCFRVLLNKFSQKIFILLINERKKNKQFHLILFCNSFQKRASKEKAHNMFSIPKELQLIVNSAIKSEVVRELIISTNTLPHSDSFFVYGDLHSIHCWFGAQFLSLSSGRIMEHMEQHFSTYFFRCWIAIPAHLEK